MPRKPRDFTKEKIGMLQPLKIDETKPRGAGKNIYWICECDCGKLVSRSSSNLQIAIRNKNNSNCGCITPKEDLTGRVFGKLKVIKENKEKPSCKENDWTVSWLCECSCGNSELVSVFASNLKKLHTISCGCVNYSIGEKNIEKILKENDISFKKEFIIKELYDANKNNPLRFDFCILNEQNKIVRLIEFDGRQHNVEYESWGGINALDDTRRKDDLKNQYCVKYGIPLIRIPYYERDKLNIQKLLIDTTFLVK